MISPSARKTYTRLVNVWDQFFFALARLDHSAEGRYANGRATLEVLSTDDESVAFDIKPIVLNLPEYPNAAQRRLYVVVRGRLTLNKVESKNSDLVTRYFSTEAAYFRESSGHLEHVFGAHFDFSLNELGHPIFHSQMKSYAEFSEFVFDKYGSKQEVTDYVKNILGKVRVPTAQMDIFSIFVQVCADHLLSSKLGDAACEAFNTLLQKNGALQGAGYQSEELTSQKAAKCYRSGHWYPRIDLVQRD